MSRRTSYSWLQPTAVKIVVRALAEELYRDREPSRIAFVPQGEHGLSLLASALALPRWPYYKGTLRKAAALLRSLVKNHPFIDGNKRFALAMVTLFLAANRYMLLSPKEEAVSFELRVAHETELSVFSIEHWLRKFCLYRVPKKSARQRLKRMAARYPGGLSALESTIDDYETMLTALEKQVGKAEATSKLPRSSQR